LVEKAMKATYPRRLLREDFIAITEALHRRYQGTTSPQTNTVYPMRGYNAVHTYVVKANRDRYMVLEEQVEREMARRAAAATSSNT
jgi:hypothetical protein